MRSEAEITDIIASLRSELEKLADPVRRDSAQRYFRERIELYGIGSNDVKMIERDFYAKIRNMNKESVFRLCLQLWQSPFFEEHIIACNWADKRNREFEEADLEIFAGWLHKYVSNWATCDTLCNHAVGNLIMKYPHRINTLKSWARSENRWVKRGSAVSLIIPARKGLFRDDIAEIATILLHDTDDMVQKGYGWMLKAASEPDRKMVFDFVMQHKATMPRTALRYAIEKMPAEMRKKAMEKEISDI